MKRISSMSPKKPDKSSASFRLKPSKRCLRTLSIRTCSPARAQNLARWDRSSRQVNGGQTELTLHGTNELNIGMLAQDLRKQGDVGDVLQCSASAVSHDRSDLI